MMKPVYNALCYVKRGSRINNPLESGLLNIK